MAERPGVMIYFDIRPAIKRLDLEERGELFTAIMDFAELGVIPDLDGMAALCFDLIKPKIERDGERYEEVRTQRQYAVYCREVKRNGGEPVSYDEWLSGDNQPLSTDNGSYPTTTTTVTTTATASTTTTANPSTKGEGAGKGEVEGYGETERENQPLTPEEFERKRQRGLALLNGA